jgi:PAS domain S-box-containing protein
MGRPLRVLFIEDSADDAELASIELRRSGYEVSAERVDDAASLTGALEASAWDLVLCDHGLPGFSSAEALGIVRARDVEVPVVILSGSIGEEAAIEALKSGAMDVVIKTNLRRLGLIADRELREAATRRDHRAAEQALRDSEARKTAMFDGALDAIVAIDHDARIVDLNPAAEVMFGRSRANLCGRPITDLVPLTDHLEHAAEYDRSTAGQPAADGEQTGGRIELSARRADGSPFPTEVSVVHVTLSGRSLWTAFVRDISQRRRAEEAARVAEHSYRMLFEGSPLAMLCFDADTRAILEANDAAVGLYGYSHQEFHALKMTELVAPEDPSSLFAADNTSRVGAPAATARHLSKDGRQIEVAVTAHAVRFGDRDARFVVAEDVGERESLARQLRQSQRLESLGQLAGGVAHDFNNLLGVILNYAGFVKDQLDDAADESDPRWQESQRDLLKVEQAAQRAVRMTRQLLLFSRREITQAEIINVNDVVTDLHELLARTLGEHVQLAAALASDLWLVEIDLGQLEQVVVNLTVNARDAMPDGGQITIDTANVTVDADFAATRPGIPPGRYMRLRVSDTGIGMDERTVDRAFEPFFTTKPTGEGTGLGLATIYGIVTQAHGRVQIYSEPGVGTTVSVLLPAADDRAPRSSQASGTPARPARGHETILLVEDKDDLRDATRRMLDRNGYTVLIARDGTEAITLADHHSGTIDLLLTDVIMPRMIGPDLAASIVARRPAIRVLYISGYAQPALGARGTLPPGVVLLEKPFTQPALLTKVRDVLDTPDATASPDPRPPAHTERSLTPSKRSPDPTTASRPR